MAGQASDKRSEDTLHHLQEIDPVHFLLSGPFLLDFCSLMLLSLISLPSIAYHKCLLTMLQTACTWPDALPTSWTA